MAGIGVLIVDDHKIVRQGLKSLIEGENSLSVAGEAASGEEALDAYLRDCPDVVILDISMPGIGGIETARRLINKDPNVRIVGLTMHTDEATINNLRSAGCCSFVSKTAPFEDLVMAVRCVNAGLSFPEDVEDSGAGCSRYEMDVLGLIGRGMSTEQIAEALSVDATVVKSCRRNFMAKI